MNATRAYPWIPTLFLLLACLAGGWVLNNQLKTIAHLRTQLASRENVSGGSDSLAFWKRQTFDLKKTLAMPQIAAIPAPASSGATTPRKSQSNVIGFSRTEEVERPEFQASLLQSLAIQSRRRYAGLLETMNLSSLEKEKIVSLISRESLAAADARDFPDGPVSPAIAADCQGEIKSLLGADRYEVYLEFVMEEPQRRIVEETQLILATRGQALDRGTALQLHQFLSTLPNADSDQDRAIAVDLDRLPFLDEHQKQVFQNVLSHRNLVARVNRQLPPMTTYGAVPTGN
jgi:hypothetical protein